MQIHHKVSWNAAISRHFQDESLSCRSVCLFLLCRDLFMHFWVSFAYIHTLGSVTFAAVQAENQSKVQARRPQREIPIVLCHCTAHDDLLLDIDLSNTPLSLSPSLLLSAWVDQNSCAHCMHWRPHSAQLCSAASCKLLLQLPCMCVCVFVWVRVCVSMVTTGSSAVNVSTSSISNKAASLQLHHLCLSFTPQPPLSLSLALLVMHFGPIWQVFVAFAVFVIFMSGNRG